MIDQEQRRGADLGFDTPRFAPLSVSEAEAIRGGWGLGAGLCVGIGFACKGTGGIRAGACVIVGVVTDAEITIIKG